MATKSQRANFSVEPFLPSGLKLARKPVAATADTLLGLRRLADFYYGFSADLSGPELSRAVVDGLGVTLRYADDELAHVPAEGPCIVVANHPHGMLDGLIVMQLLACVRPDFKVMANHFLARFTQLIPLFFQINPFGGKAAIRHNITTARAATTWLNEGKMLMVFPGGEVSSLNRREWHVSDPAWDEGVARFAEKSGAPVVPMHIGGRNSALFQLAGLINPNLRTALLIREMMNKHGTTIDVRFGRAIAPSLLESLGERAAVTRYLRTKTYLLKEKSGRGIALGPIDKRARPRVDIALGGDPAAFAAEIDGLPPTQQLLTSGANEVYYATADQIPLLLQELGRLRELSFREVGEGTGKSSDLDLYDSYYTHLFVWDRQASRIVGGYRLGHTDRILDRYGSKGLYVHSLFKLAPELTNDLRSALELGRSFVASEYQRSYSSLMLLWKGIANYVIKHPQYRVLFGPVSISNDYHPVSQEILVQFLRQTNSEVRRASLVKPRTPFRLKTDLTQNLVDLDSIDLRIIADLLNTVESEDKGVPVLLRQYLKLGGQILGFNIDPQFNNSIDCLLWVDLMRTELPHLNKYMGTAEAARFRALHTNDEVATAGTSRLAG